MMAPLHSTEIFSFVFNTKVEIYAGTVRRQSDTPSDPGLEQWVMVKAMNCFFFNSQMGRWAAVLESGLQG